MVIRIALVSCVKTKRPSASPACDLYISPWFLSARHYAETHANAWYILSAQHGVLRVDQLVEPYERTLTRMRKSERLAWAQIVQNQLLELLPADAEVIFLAGLPYRKGIEPFLRQRGYSVTVPLEGLRLGPQLRRLKELNAE
jgi:Family of unknown function (DUF6884)